jgi:hypothetical protein
MAFLEIASDGTNKVEQDASADQGLAMPAVELDPLAGPDGGERSRRLARYWLGQIEKVDDEQKRWLKRGKSIEKRYRDERNRVDEEGQRRSNSLWANVQILFPALYGRCPVPIAERRFLDKDEVGRAAASIIERALRNEIEINDFHDAVGSAVMDYLLPGRGSVWVRYEPQLGPGLSIPTDAQNDMRDAQGEILDEDDEDPFSEPEEDEEETKAADTGDIILRESVPTDYIPWMDDYNFPAKARKWKEVRAKGKRCYMSRDQMVKRFGPEIGKAIPLQSDDREKRNQQEQRHMEDEQDSKGEVFEIWDQETLAVYWVAKDYDFLCDRKADPLHLENFFPCPRPLMANATNSTMIPVPDYVQYQDQAVMIDELTNRISQLTKACKIAGVYNASEDAISRLLDESVENELIPVDTWAKFADAGGMAGQISLLPIKDIIGVLQELVQIKAQIIQEMDRLTGINDVLRGTTDARETMGGQRIKTNNGGTRLQHRQADVARFAKEVICLVAEIMCKHFSPRSLIEASGALYEEGLGAPDVKALGFGQNAWDDQDQSSLPMVSAPPMLPPSGGAAPGAPMPQAAPFPPSGASQSPGPPIMLPGPPGLPPRAPGVPGAVRSVAAPGSLPPAAGAPPMRFTGPPQMGGVQQPMPMGMPGMALGGKLSDPTKILLALYRIKKAIDLLRDDHIRGFRIDIEIDSTVYGDQAQEKADRVEFIKAVTQYLQQAGVMAMQMPQVAPLLGKLLQFGVRGYRVGRDLEHTIEEFTEQAVHLAQQHAAMQGQQPNPQAIKAQADAARGHLELQKTQLEGQHLQIKAQGDQVKAEAETRAAQTQAAAEQANSQADLESKRMDLAMRQMEMEIEKLRLQVELEKLRRPMPAAMTGGGGGGALAPQDMEMA